MGPSAADASVYLPYPTLRKIDVRADALLLSIKAKSGQLESARQETESILRRQRGLRSNHPTDFELSVAEGLIEALMLTGLGGALGILLAGFLCWMLLGWLPALAPGVPVQAGTKGFWIALLVGVVFGVGPALKAARKALLQ